MNPLGGPISKDVRKEYLNKSGPTFSLPITKCFLKYFFGLTPF